jgi:membrane fusion protein, peptide pheromone/bacteriocin exporter
MEHIFPPEVIRNSAEKHFSTFSRKLHVIYISILLFIAAAIVSLFLIKTEITVLSRGMIRSAKEPIPVTIPINAVIQKSFIRENCFVQAGDTLLWLDKEKLEKSINHLKGLMNENNHYLRDMALLLNNESRSVELKTKLFKKSIQEYEQRISEFDTEIALLQKKYQRTKKLFDKQVIPDAEKEEKEYQLKKKKEEKKLFIKLTHNKWQHLATEYKVANKEYQSEITGFKKDLQNYFIKAPHTGYISNFKGLIPGNFVTLGQVIGMIQPAALDGIPLPAIAHIIKNKKL